MCGSQSNGFTQAHTSFGKVPADLGVAPVAATFEIDQRAPSAFQDVASQDQQLNVRPANSRHRLPDAVGMPKVGRDDIHAAAFQIRVHLFGPHAFSIAPDCPAADRPVRQEIPRLVLSLGLVQEQMRSAIVMFVGESG